MSDGNWFHAAGADTAKDRRPKFVDVETTTRSPRVDDRILTLYRAIVAAGAAYDSLNLSHLHYITYPAIADMSHFPHLSVLQYKMKTFNSAPFRLN